MQDLVGIHYPFILEPFDIQVWPDLIDPCKRCRPDPS